jgi:hypothetical protein
MLHLIKLAVGIDEVEQIAPLHKRRQTAQGTVYHRTRMYPTRAAEICPGGSLYWVVKGLIAVRQPIVAFHRKKDDSGKSVCLIELALAYIPVQATARRPFQGWRYLKADDAPPDGRSVKAYVDPSMPADMKKELRKLGLL